MSPFEVWKDVNTGVVFYFSHSDAQLTTGVMMIPAGTSLPKHNRPYAYENLVQVSGKCLITVFDSSDKPTEHELDGATTLRMDKGQYHIHANPYEEPSYTLFKAEGDITEVMKVLRATFERIV